MWSRAPSALVPSSVTILPLTWTRPWVMSSSAWRRLATPAWARIFWRRSSLAAGCGVGSMALRLSSTARFRSALRSKLVFPVYGLLEGVAGGSGCGSFGFEGVVGGAFEFGPGTFRLFRSRLIWIGARIVAHWGISVLPACLWSDPAGSAPEESRPIWPALSWGLIR